MAQYKLSELVIWEDNYNKGDVDGIARSIRRFGFNNAPRIWQNKQVRGGNHTVLALRQIQAEGTRPDLDKAYPPENVTVKGKEWLIDCVDVSHLDTLEATAFAIADNQHARNATYDQQKLLAYLQDIRVDPTLFDASGVTQDAMSKLKNLVDQLNHANQAQQAAPEPPDENPYDVQPGDLWQIGPHRLICGDVTDPDVIQRLCDRPINGIVTSPPYAEQRSDQYASIPAGEYVSWWGRVQFVIRSHLTPDASLFLNIKPHVENGQRSLYVIDLVQIMVREWGWCLIDEFSWSRNGVPGSWRNRFKNGFEPVYHFARTPDVKFRPHHVGATSQGEADKVHNANTGDYYNVSGVSWDYALPSNRLDFMQTASGDGHPAAFPDVLPAFFIRAFSDPLDVWLDPFAGSGSTLVAAQQFDRVGYGVEIDPAYCAITLARLAAMGLTPCRL